MRVSVGHRLVNLATTLAFVVATIWPSYSFATQTRTLVDEPKVLRLGAPRGQQVSVRVLQNGTDGLDVRFIYQGQEQRQMLTPSASVTIGPWKIQMLPMGGLQVMPATSLSPKGSLQIVGAPTLDLLNVKASLVDSDARLLMLRGKTEIETLATAGQRVVVDGGDAILGCLIGGSSTLTTTEGSGLSLLEGGVIGTLENNGTLYLNTLVVGDKITQTLEKNVLSIGNATRWGSVFTGRDLVYDRAEKPEGLELIGKMTLGPRAASWAQKLSDLTGFQVRGCLEVALRDVVTNEPVNLENISFLKLMAMSLDLQHDVTLASGDWRIENLCRIGLSNDALRKLHSTKGHLHIVSGSYDGQFAQVIAQGNLRVETTKGDLLRGAEKQIPESAFKNDNDGNPLNLPQPNIPVSGTVTDVYRAVGVAWNKNYVPNGAFTASGGDQTFRSAGRFLSCGAPIIVGGDLSFFSTEETDQDYLDVIGLGSAMVTCPILRLERAPGREWGFNQPTESLTSEPARYFLGKTITLNVPKIFLIASHMFTGGNLVRPKNATGDQEFISQGQKYYQPYNSGGVSLPQLMAGHGTNLDLGKFQLVCDGSAQQVTLTGESGTFANPAARITLKGVPVLLASLGAALEADSVFKLYFPWTEEGYRCVVPFGGLLFDPQCCAVVCDAPVEGMYGPFPPSAFEHVWPFFVVFKLMAKTWGRLYFPELGDEDLMIRLLANGSLLAAAHPGGLTEDTLKKFPEPAIYFKWERKKNGSPFMMPYLYLPELTETIHRNGVFRALDLHGKFTGDVAFKNYLFASVYKGLIESKGAQHWLSLAKRLLVPGGYRDVIEALSGMHVEKAAAETISGGETYTQGADFKGTSIQHTASKLIDEVTVRESHVVEEGKRKLTNHHSITSKATNREAEVIHKIAPEISERAVTEEAPGGIFYVTDVLKMFVTVNSYVHSTIKWAKRWCGTTQGAKGEEHQTVDMGFKKGPIHIKADRIHIEKKLGAPLPDNLWEAVKDHPNLTIEEIAEIHHVWKQKTVRMISPALATIISIALSIVTAGPGGLGQLFATQVLSLSAGGIPAGMAAAALSQTVSQATISMINHQGNLKGVLKDLSSEAFLKGLIKACVAQGVMGALKETFQLPSHETFLQNAETLPFEEIAGYHLKDQLLRASVYVPLDVALDGESIE